MVNYTQLTKELGNAWRETHPNASEEERLRDTNALTVLVNPSHKTLFFELLDQAMRGTRTQEPGELERYKEGVRLLDAALGEIEVYRQHAMAGIAARDEAEVIKWLIVMEQEYHGAKEVITRLLILKSGPLKGSLED